MPSLSRPATIAGAGRLQSAKRWVCSWTFFLIRRLFGFEAMKRCQLTFAKSRRFLALLVALSGFQLAVPARAIQISTVYTVRNTSDVIVASACTNNESGCSLRGAITAANASSSSTIQFAIPASDPNCVAGVCTITLTGALPDIGGPNNSFINVSIEGPGADKLIVKAGTGVNARIFNVTSVGTTTFFQLTIRDGHLTSLGGAGIQTSGNGTINVTNCALIHNISDTGSGGAIRNPGSTLNITSCTFSGNSAAVGGAMSLSGLVTVSSCIFTGNSTSGNGSGGGISYNSASSTLTVTNTTFSGNSNSGNGIGAGMWVGGGTVNLISSTINGGSNTGGGGGISNFGATLNVVNSTISGNQSTSGGGIDARNGTINLTNSTISGNTATNSNGGGGIIRTSATINVKSSIIAGNTSSLSGHDVAGTVVSAGFNLIGKKDGSTGFTAATDLAGTVASPLDPKLDPSGLQNNGGLTKTIALLFGSPAIDKGTSAGLTGNLSTDQRGSGFPRSFNDPTVPNANGGDGTDIGAFEVQTSAPSSLGNISTRVRVLTGDNALIGGMIATGSAPKKVIIRALGPTLTDLGLAGALSDPTLELFQGNTPLATNDDWKNGAQQTEIANSGFAPNKDAESAIIATLTPNQNYTAIVRGKNGETGIGVVEAFDLDQAASSKLGNISTRGFVDVDDNVMIAGLIVIPSNGPNLKVLVRALGPTLGDFGVAGFLANPTLDLVSSNGTVLRSNDNWRSDQQAEIAAAQLAPNHDEEAALIQSLPPGAYTAIVRGSARTTGVGLVEVYNIP
jgi:hypothetical protein